MFVFVFASAFSAQRIMPNLGVNRLGSLTAMYQNTGLIIGFYAALLEHMSNRLTASEASLIAQEFFGSVESYVSNDNILPDIIVIMSEAFMDITSVYNLEFSSDPIANFRRLRQAHISGNVVVPVFGGGTANTEFEFLTGVPLYLMGRADYVPYSNPSRYFYRDVLTSMPWLLRTQGYRTVAVHPYYAWFFSRDAVYPRLGFEHVYFSEDMPDASLRGWFISDEYFTDRVIDEIIYAENTDTPLFLFGVSMQNHWEFWDYKYTHNDPYFEFDVTAFSPLLNEVELGRVNSFVQGIYDADRQLGRLIKFLENRSRPTILVFFGDHMPILGAHDDTIFETLGYISSQNILGWNEYDKQKMFTTPYLVWSNFADTNQDWGVLSAYFLGARVLDLSGVMLNNYWNYILHLNQYFRALTENHYVDNYGNFSGLYGVMQLEHIIAFDALNTVKWFGNDDFYYWLQEFLQ